MKISYLIDSHLFDENHFFYIASLKKNSTAETFHTFLIAEDFDTIHEKLYPNRIMIKNILTKKSDLKEITSAYDHEKHALINRIESVSLKNGFKVAFRLEYGSNEAVLEHESQFTDLIVLSFKDHEQNSFIKNLSSFQCPLLILSPDFNHIENIYTYLSNSGKVNLIKNLIHLFPRLSTSTPACVYLPYPAGDEDIKTEKLLIEFLKANLPDLGIQHLFPDQKLITLLENCNNYIAIFDKKDINENNFKSILNLKRSNSFLFV